MGTPEQPVAPLRRTSLYEAHCALGARIVEFSGWEMPVQYTGIVEEHRAVRSRAGLFDVSHMGEFSVTGMGALDFLQWLVPNNVGRLAIHQGLYTQLCRPEGGTIDDLIVYRMGKQDYLLIVNAGTMEKDWAWVNQQAQGRNDVALRNVSFETALIAFQGPLAAEILQGMTSTDLSAIEYYHCAPGEIAGIPCTISRTGYTGEDGFELFHAWQDAPRLWQALLEQGRPANVLPAGLGARDTLRLEAGYCLYGHELTEEINPLEAGLGWTIKFDAGDFIGRNALLRVKERGLARRLIGIEMLERGVARAGYALYADGVPVGALTSGTFGPTVNKNIGMGYVDLAHATPGTRLEVDVHGRRLVAEVVKLPFYKRTRT
jgi:aminomethyltransferase